MTTTRSLQLVLIVLGIFVVAFYLVLLTEKAEGSAPTGLPATIGTTTLAQSVTAGTAELLFATSTGCAARTIGTRQGELRLTFSDINGARPTAQAGYPQTASTTVVYDGGVWGCDAVYAYPYVTETVTVSESF